MDKIKELTKQKALIERIVDKTEDEKELKKLSAELDEINESILEEKANIKAEEKAQAILEAKEKELAEKQVKDAKENKKTFANELEITQQGEYKGVNLKRAVGLARMKNPVIEARARVNYEDTEKVAKHFVDMVEKATSAPVIGKTMTEGSTTAGGYITPTDERMELLAYMRESSVALQDATVIPMNTDTLTYPVENQKVAVSFRAEGSAVSAQSATFTQASLSTTNLDAYTPASKELVQDSPLLIAMLMDQFGESVAQKVDSAVFNGTGSPVSGVFTAAGYSEVFSSGSTNFSALLTTNLDGLISKVYATVQDTRKLKWYGHPSVFAKYIFGLKDSNGEYLFMRSQDGSGMGNMLGYPVKWVYQAPSATAVGGNLCAFGDLSGMLVGERLNSMQLFYDPYTDAANGNDRFYWWTRWAFSFALPNKMGRLASAGS